ncbi:lytic polysaccharide monooxygenase auxiliary activity family 9 protein [Nocardiopsis chromatogenes]|uniref:lytic polysaccharide monooxygenase auxiliary activity family 9 protein n=1 Tax=Nocardiopsis chromatogenes TaxID=280239 RepID=UPI00034604FE|nr:lytic polysaccharide monooxygenase auxiliary activity family 9 protein [Nocardiopsis chromatogenes]
MHLRRKSIQAASVLAAAPLALALLPTSAAYAHGYVSSPASRQAQCAEGTVECGPIKWEPQSVEGPKGLTSCSGGNEAFAELDDDSKGWSVEPVGTSLDFTWTFTARHATSNWEYYVGGDRVGTVDGNGQQPPSTVTHNVDLSGYSGQQKVLAVWNIADTPNAFYACVDVNVGAA